MNRSEMRARRSTAILALAFAATAGHLLAQVPLYAPYAGPASELYLGAGGRFRVRAEWRVGTGEAGSARGVLLSPDTGTFWFFREDNVELVVKVLDGCTVNGRFWVFAGGLTNVEVDLSVEDTYTGESRTYHNPPSTRYQPIQDTAAFATCAAPPRPCGLGTAEEIAATPRPDARAEFLALTVGGGLTADPDTYARISSDLAAIEALEPAVAGIPARPLFEPSELTLRLQPPYDYNAWDCLDAWYGGTAELGATSTIVYIHLSGLFNPDYLLSEYRALPGVQSALPSYEYHPGSPPPPREMCATASGEVLHYFYADYRTGPGLENWYFASPAPGEPPALLGHWDAAGPEPPPDWLLLRQDCFQLVYYP